MIVRIYQTVRCFFIAGAFFLAIGCSNLPAQRPAVRLEKAHIFGSSQVEFSPDGQLLGTGGFNGDIKIWFFPHMNMKMLLKAHERTVRGIVWLDNNTLASGSDDGQVVLWELAGKEPKEIRKKHFPSAVKGLVLFPGSRMLVSGHKDGTVRLLEYPSLRTLRETNLGARILAMRSQPGGTFVAVSTEGKQVLLLDRDLQISRTLPPPRREVYSLAFSPDQRQLAGGGWFNLYLWNLDRSSLVEWVTPHFGKIPSLDYSPDGKKIATISRVTDSRIFLIQSETGNAFRHLLRHSLCGTALRFSPDGRYIASTSDDRSVRVYDLQEPYPPS